MQSKNKIILVTGGTGSIGSELVIQLLKHHPKQIRVFSRSESRQYDLMERLGYPENVRMLIGDVRDKDRLAMAMENVHMVFHAAALKHVPFCEYNPHEVIKTNIMGSQNVIDTALANGVARVIAISTDKAADPHNVLGVSKLMMEKLFVNANHAYWGRIALSCVRFGNVAWSDGSVLQRWKKQAESTGVISVTNPDATRFFMSIQQAAALTLKAAQLSRGGEIFVLKMPSITLADLADMFIQKHFPGRGIKIKESGRRAGDKDHEHLIGRSDHTARVLANRTMFILSPATHIYHLRQEFPSYPGFKAIVNNRQLAKLTLSSENSLDREKIATII